MTLVRFFHEAVGQDAPATPPFVIQKDLIRLRMRLIKEEFEEVQQELVKLMNADPDQTTVVLRGLLKELCDLRYVVEGCAVAMGLPIDEAFAEVHRSNMSKLGGGIREDGKVLKGPNYHEPDMAQFIPDILDLEVE